MRAALAGFIERPQADTQIGACKRVEPKPGGGVKPFWVPRRKRGMPGVEGVPGVDSTTPSLPWSGHERQGQGRDQLPGIGVWIRGQLPALPTQGLGLAAEVLVLNAPLLEILDQAWLWRPKNQGGTNPGGSLRPHQRHRTSAWPCNVRNRSPSGGCCRRPQRP